MSQIPNRVLNITIPVIIVGFLIVFISAFISHNPEGFPLKDLVRDIGIAIMVAGIISLTYEWSTKETESKYEMKSVLDRVLSKFIPEVLWNEIQTEIFNRKAFRTDMEMEIELFKEFDDIDGNKVILPENVRILKTRLSYLLKGMSASKHHVDIVHHLDEHMRNNQLNVPRFITAALTDENGTVTNYTGKNLDNIIDTGKGRLFIPSNRCPAISYHGSGVKVVVERYELVNVPGLYTMVLPEMVIPSNNNNSISITLSKQTGAIDDVGLQIETWFNTQKHNFDKDKNADKWIFNSIMLPGQGFSLIFKPSSIK